MTTILHKRGTGVPAADAFTAPGEILIDTESGVAYTLTDAGEVVALSGAEVDLSDYVSKSKQNDVTEGKFRLVWDHSYDPDFPFNGAVGYDGNNDDPDSVGGSFLYAAGTRGTVSIGRDGDMELHGPSEIKGVPDREGHLPWITDFSYVQAADFLDADGNSIIGQGGDAGVEIGPEPTDPSQGMLWLNDADQTVYIWDENKWLEFPVGNSIANIDGGNAASKYLPSQNINGGKA